MAIQTAGRGRDTHLIKITLGYEPTTHKRLYHTETFKGTKRDARLREAELKIQHRAKRLVPSSVMTFRECFDLYCDEVGPRLSLSRFHSCKTRINHCLMPSVGDKELKELARADFQKIYDSMQARSLSPHTIHGLHSVTRAIITWAIDKGFLRADPINGVTLPKIPKVRPEYLTYEETQAFFDVAGEYWYGNAFKAQFMTGLRNQELMAQMWEDIDFETATMRVRRACVWISGAFKGFKGTKTGEERIIELDESTVNFFKSIKVTQETHIGVRKSHGLGYGDERLVFCTMDGHVPNHGVVTECLKRILSKIGITRRFRWYGIRHTHATHLLATEGANAKMIANRLGHSVEMLFRIYGHEIPGQQREALSKLSSRIKLYCSEPN